MEGGEFHNCVGILVHSMLDRAHPGNHLATAPVPPSVITVYYHHTPIPCRGKMLLLSAKYCAAFSPAGGKKKKSSFNCSCFSYRYYKHPALPSIKAPSKQAG